MSSEAANTIPPAPQALDPWLLDLLACPACTQRWPIHLNEAQDQLLCQCGRYAFPIRDGIPIMLVDEATVLNANAQPEDVSA